MSIAVACSGTIKFISLIFIRVELIKIESQKYLSNQSQFFVLCYILSKGSQKSKSEKIMENPVLKEGNLRCQNTITFY